MCRTSVIIPTYNRPQELVNCLKSLLEQTVKPDQVIIIDDGDLQQRPLETDFAAAGVEYIYHRKETPGLTASRNAGIALASGEIIFFFDDDVLLFPNYIEEILKVYRQVPEDALGGVGGLIDNHPKLGLKDWLRFGIEVFFGANSVHEGRMMASGFCGQLGETPFPLKTVKQVDFLSGGVSSFYKKVFTDYSFSDRYRGYGMGEDKDFTLAISKKYPLYIAPKAKLLHLESPLMRADKREWGRMELTGTYMRFRDHARKGWWSDFFFWYAVCGYLFARFAGLVLFPNRGKVQQLRGSFDAIRDIWGGKVFGARD